MNKETLFSKIEAYETPSTVFFRSIEIKILKERFGELFRGKKILDLGCGDGIAALAVFDEPIDYGLDNESGALKIAEKSNAYKKTIFADATKIPLQDESLDTVFSNCSIEHMENIKDVLQEVFRVLKKGGLFIFTGISDNFKNYGVLSFLKMGFIAKRYGVFRDKRLKHLNVYSLDGWNQVLKEAGFKAVDGYYYLGKPEIELWDFLTIMYYCLHFLGKFGREINLLFYKILFRKIIYGKFVSSKPTDSKGAAVCVIVKKEAYI
jgi:ubiquinone/menaquinone biosynthesis C-methylase UbiE